MPETSRWGTVKEAAALAGLNPMTIRRYIHAGHLPAKRLGPKMIRVDLDAVESLLQPIAPGVPDGK